MTAAKATDAEIRRAHASLYVAKRWSARAVADELGIGPSTWMRRCKSLGLELRTNLKIVKSAKRRYAAASKGKPCCGSRRDLPTCWCSHTGQAL